MIILPTYYIAITYHIIEKNLCLTLNGSLKSISFVSFNPSGIMGIMGSGLKQNQIHSVTAVELNFLNPCHCLAFYFDTYIKYKSMLYSLNS